MIGYDPIVETMVIVAGQDFSHFFRVDPTDPFPSGTILTLKIYSREQDQLGAWQAISVQPAGALVQIRADDLDPVPDAATFKVYVQYPGWPTGLCWYRGRVWRRT
jgi:hypothetical protein